MGAWRVSGSSGGLCPGLHLCRLRRNRAACLAQATKKLAVVSHPQAGRAGGKKK
jgi:hypothetical protein